MRFQQPLRASALTDLLGPDLLREPLPGACFGLRLLSLDSPYKSQSGSLTCVGRRVPLRYRENLQASLVLVEGETEVSLPVGILQVKVASVHKALSRLLIALENQWEDEPPFASGDGNNIHSSAVVEGVLEGEVTVGAGAYVAAGAYIGRGTRLEARATVMKHAVIGRDCVIQSGVVIGCEGFGFFDAGEGELTAMPHRAGVRLGDRIFVGAQTVIASGVLHPTLIGDGCKLDSHVQIAHNVELGRECVMASQGGIAGSTVVGDGLRMGGAASISGHLRLGKQVTVAACSAVTKDLADGAVVAGFPARPIQQWRRQEAALRKMGGSSS